jgi:alkanesulfonate monooxygenase SsuD/methylene tetrahydromethanopterin reductase-like flavin-dependent oxidoreductase (luciferase family)
MSELIGLGKTAKAAGVEQIWVTDNLQSRNVFVVLAALAANIPINLGTAVMVQYFRNPVDVADAVAAVSEMMDAEELSIGIARGNAGTSRFINTAKPISMLRETAQSLTHLLAGEPVQFSDYPTISSYFNFASEASFNLNFIPKTPIRLYCGGNGPLSLAVGGEFMDGLIFGGTFQAVSRAGCMPPLIETFNQAATKAGKGGSLPKVAEIKISVSRDGKAARQFVKRSAGSRILSLRDRGYTEEQISRLGVTPEEMDRLAIAAKDGSSPSEFISHVTDAMIDGIFVAGDSTHCQERMVEIVSMAREHGFQQIMFSEWGPEPGEALKLLCNEIIPSISA